MILFFFILLVLFLALFYFILKFWDKIQLNLMRRKYARTEERTEQIVREQGIDIKSARRIAESELGIESTVRAVKPKRRHLFSCKSVNDFREDVSIVGQNIRLPNKSELKTLETSHLDTPVPISPKINEPKLEICH